MPLVPLFPLPNVVLFPGVSLPLHIFEPRYRAMVADALEGDRRIGMVLLRAGWAGDYEGAPPVHAIGCTGVIVQEARLDDGRYHIVLNGLDRFRIVHEDRARLYRRAAIAPLPEAPLDDPSRAALGALRARIELHLGLLTVGAQTTGASYATHLAAMSDIDFVHVLAQYLSFEPIEKQALLERDTVVLRAQSLLDLLEMRRHDLAKRSGPDMSH